MDSPPDNVIIVKGNLRINPKNYMDAYISVTGEEIDILIGGTRARDRALNGDLVEVKLNKPEKWKVLYDTIRNNWEQWKHMYHAQDEMKPNRVSDPISEEKEKKRQSERNNSQSDASHPELAASRTPSNDGDVVETSEKLERVNVDSLPVEPLLRTAEEIAARKKKKKERKKQAKKEEKERKQMMLLASQCSPVISNSSESERPSCSFSKGNNSESDALNSSKVTIKTASHTDGLQPGCPRSRSSVSSLSDGDGNVNHSHVDALPTDDTLVDGLPRSLLELSVPELIKYPFGKWCIQKTGTVVQIVEKNHSRTCGGLLSVDPRHLPYLKFSPTDSRIPRMLIPRSECPSYITKNLAIYFGTLFLAKITDWPSGSDMPLGTIRTEIGPMGTIDTETQMLLSENDVIDEPFPVAVESELESRLSNWTISETERAYRRDFTNDCVFTIDPLTARDLDDALSIDPLAEHDFDTEEQLYEVGVHIADVSFFIPENSPLDEEAKRRSTSFYLVHRVIHMLPRILSEKACSLTPGEEKLTFSVVWKMDGSGKIYDTWFGRSIIRSCIKLAYEHAFEMICNPEKEFSPSEFPPILLNQWSIDDIRRQVNLLNAILSTLRKKRFDNGALEINKMKYSFTLHPQSFLPTGFRAQETNAAHSLVQELMLLANISVAKRIFQFAPDLAFLRCHPRPDNKLLRELNTFCTNYGIKIDCSTSLTLQQSLTSIKSASANLYRVVSQFFLRAMPAASYLCSGEVTDAKDFHHFALNEQFYTHFTSPIRRYPDILVHRLLAASLKYQENITLPSNYLQEIANHCNKRKTASRLVSGGSQKFFTTLFIKSAPVVETAVVTGILDQSFDVVVPSFDLKCRIYQHPFEGGSSKLILKNGKPSFKITWRSHDGSPDKEQIISMTTDVKVLLWVPHELPLKIKAALAPS